MIEAKAIFQFILLISAGVTTVSSVHILELDAVDAAFEAKPQDVNLFQATPPEGLVILNVDLLGKSRISEAEYASGLLTKQVPNLYLVAADQAMLPHSEHMPSIKWKKSRPSRQANLPNNPPTAASNGVEENDLSNQLSVDYAVAESDGSGDNQVESLPEISLIAEMPRLQQADVALTQESGYSSSSTLPKSRMSSAVIEDTRKEVSVGFPNTDKTVGETTGAISAEERESSDPSLSSSGENEGNSATQEDTETKETSSTEAKSNEGETTASPDGRQDMVSDDTLEVSDQPEPRSPSGRSLDEASIIPVNLGKGSNETSLNGKNSQTKKVFEKPTSKDHPQQSKNPITLAVAPKNLPASGTTFPLFGNGKMVRLMKDNIAVILGLILGLPVFVSTCYLLNHRRKRTGSMDITPVTSESAKKKMSTIDDTSRTVTCSIENELSSCPCEVK